jgi:hypothetical protein
MAKVSQKTRILEYLHQIDEQTGKRRSITPYAAQGLYRIGRLAARIGELRQDGHNITTTICKDPTGSSFARYAIKPPRK